MGFNYELGPDALNEQNPAVPVGKYKVRVDVVKLVEDSQSEETRGADFLVVEYTVLETLRGGTPTVDFRGRPVEVSEDGNAYRLNMTWRTSLGQATLFIMAASGIDTSKLDEVKSAVIDAEEATYYRSIANEMPKNMREGLKNAKAGDAVNWSARLNAAVAEDNPVSGTELFMTVTKTVTKKNKYDVFPHAFEPVR